MVDDHIIMATRNYQLENKIKKYACRQVQTKRWMKILSQHHGVNKFDSKWLISLAC